MRLPMFLSKQNLLLPALEVGGYCFEGIGVKKKYVRIKEISPDQEKIIGSKKLKPCKEKKEGGLWSSGPLVLWSPGPLVLWFPGLLVLWSGSLLVLSSSGSLVLRSPGPLVPWSSGPLVPFFWSPGPLVL